MSEERETIGARSSASPEVYQQTKFMAWFEKAFPWLLVSGAALGLTLMIILPIIFFQEKTAEQLLAQSNLRLALLYTTGGAIAALGLLETYRKNTNDRAKANADIKAALKNQEHQAEVLKEQIRQFDENAFKERKAERRERYTEAVEQLGSKEAPVRIGGVYTLIGLVDEWLEEKNLEYSEQLKEGQVIINNLCAYIRSPFTLTSYYDELSEDTPSSDGIYKDNQQKFYTDKADFKAEADVRLSIIKEIHDRLQSPDKNTPGAWSDFEYDFSGSTFFYPVDLTNSYYIKPVNFSGSTYQDEVRFRGSTYQNRADFSNSIYHNDTYLDDSIYWGEAYFNDSTYRHKAIFSKSSYQSSALFSGSKYQSNWNTADFRGSTYHGTANFHDSIYQSWTYFHDSIYHGTADFRGSTYHGTANFHHSTYEKDATFSTSKSPSTYISHADFHGSKYQGNRNTVEFRSSQYRSTADFRGSTYHGTANFHHSTYEKDATFSTLDSPSTYREKVSFSYSTYHGITNFSGSKYQSIRAAGDFQNLNYKDVVDFSESIYKSSVDFSGSIYKNLANFSNSTFYTKPHYNKDNGENYKNVLFGSHYNNFTVKNGKGFPIYINFEGLPFGCKFLTSGQIGYIKYKFQEIEETNDRVLAAKTPKKESELSEKLQALNNELHAWREKVTTVKVEGTAPGEEDN